MPAPKTATRLPSTTKAGVILLLVIAATVAYSLFMRPQTDAKDVDSWIDEGAMACESGRYDQGLPLLKRAATVARQLNLKSHAAYAQYHMAGFKLRQLRAQTRTERNRTLLAGRTYNLPPEPLNEIEAHLLEALKAAEQLPDAAQVYRLLGYVYREQNQNLRAIASFEQALSADKNFAEAHNDLANTYFAIGDYSNAREHYKLALHINEDLSSTHYNLGLFFSSPDLAAEHPRNLDQARRHLERFLKLTAAEALPDDAERAIAKQRLKKIAEQKR